MQALILATAFFMSQAVNAEPGELAARISKRVESSRLKSNQLGLVIADSDGSVVFALNEDKLFVPASLTKIVTAAATLEKLPVGHQFLTELRAESSQLNADRLQGDLYLKGGGDAGFVSESMWFLVNELTRTGLREIEGDIVVDDSRFDAVRFDASRDQGRVDRAYDSPIGAMTFNWSAVNVFVRPGAKAGDPARVFIDPENDYIEVTNKAKTVAASGKTKLSVQNVGATKKSRREEIVVTGTIPASGTEFVAYKSISQPEIWAGYNLLSFLKQRGISVKGSVRAGRTPAKSQVMAVYKSRPVSELVAGMMKYSNNYIAEILTKNLAAEIRGVPGTMESGVSVLRSYLKENGIEAEIYNPSGLSRKNQFRARDLLRVLLKVKSDFRIYPEYLAGLPIAGVDGTLKRRLGDENWQGQVRAKTGHLSGVAGLGGFASSAQGHLYSFVFLFNGGADDAYKSKDLFDKIIVELLKSK